MGFDWGITLQNKKKGIKLSLMNFCGWNSRTIYNRMLEYFVLDGKTIIDYDGEEIPNEGYRHVLSDKIGLFNWLHKVDKINDIFHGVSERKIDGELFSDKIADKYFDLCYDLDIDGDSTNIFILMKLSSLWKLYRDSDFLDQDDYEKTWEDWTLCLDASW